MKAVRNTDKAKRILAYMLDEKEFLSPYGTRPSRCAPMSQRVVLDLPGNGQALIQELPGWSAIVLDVRKPARTLQRTHSNMCATE